MANKPLARKHAEDYESDDGFVEDAPKSKKIKTEVKPRNTTMQQDDEGNEYWELSGKRRVQISSFKGNTMINIREYYESNGKMLPGKKGISMTVEQYSAFLELVPGIEDVLKSKGIEVPRPSFYGKAKTADDGEGEAADEDRDDDEEEVAAESSRQSGRLEKYNFKKNHEATSDEDEE